MARAEGILADYVALVKEGHAFSNGDLNSYFRVVTEDREVALRELVTSGRQRNFGKKPVAPKSANQRRYVEAIERNDLVFGIGPAGTGKTYLAVAMGISALLGKRVSRIILTRPGGGGGRAARLPAGDAAGEGGPVPAPALRRPVRYAGRGQGGQAAGALRDRGRAAGLHARAHAERQLHHHGRGAELDARADEDDAHAPGLQLQDGGDGRRHADRSAGRQTQRIAGGGRGAARRGGHPLHPIRRPRRGAPPSGAEDRQGIRAVPTGDRSGAQLQLKLEEPRRDAADATGA